VLPKPEPALPASVSPTIAAKDALRRTMRQKRAGLTDRTHRTAVLWDNVVARLHVLGDDLTVLAFQGVRSEPNTTGLVERLEADGHIVLLPRVEGEHLVAVVHRPGDALHEGAFGIAEPDGPAVDPAVVDVVLVPGLAFTRDGRRLGQGGGFYDRFLPSLRPDCITLGVCFAEQVVDDLPSEEHDWVLHAVLTDRDVQSPT
jgi:5-formyltetrahydrofolate cyclo-ligase